MEAARQRWYAGIRVCSRRPLSSEELGELREIRKKTYSGLVKLSSIVLVFVLSFAGVFRLRAEANIDAIFFLLLFLVIAWAARGMLSSLPRLARFGRQLSRDLAEGVVEVCVGSPADLVVNHAAVLGDGRLLPGISARDSIEIEVLPRSHLLWRRNGRDPIGVFVVRAASTAVLPPHAAMAANFVRPLDEENRLFFHQRLLSEEEKKELESYVPIVSPAEIVASTIAAAATFAAAATMIHANGIRLLVLGAAALLFVWRFPIVLRRVRLRRLFGEDLAAGSVIIFREKVAETEGEKLFSDPEEFLQSSRILWSRGGAPADWRKMFLPDSD